MEGENDHRNLWGEGIRAVRESAPKALLFEMVSGFLFPQFDRAREEVIQSLTELGYTVDMYLANACDYGVPQSRERCFLIGHTMNSSSNLPRQTDLAAQCVKYSLTWESRTD